MIMGLLSRNDASETAKMDKRDEQVMKVAHGISLKDLKSGGSGKGK